MIDRIKRSLTIVVALLLLITGCARSDTAGNNDGYKANKIRIAYSSAFGSALTQIMMLTGSLEETLPDGVSVEWLNIAKGTDQRDALVSGHIDFVALSAPTAVAAIENDMPIVLVASSMLQSAKIYSNNPDIKSIEDIGKDCKISNASIGNTYHLALMSACRDRFGDPHRLDNNLVAMDSADVLASLESSKDLDGAVLGLPYMKWADQKESLVMILDLTPVMREYRIGTYLSSNQQFIHDNPELVNAFMQAYTNVIDFMNNDPGEAARILSEYYEEVEAADLEEEIRNLPPVSEFSESAYDKLATLMYEVGILEKSPEKFSALPNYDSILKVD